VAPTVLAFEDDALRLIPSSSLICEPRHEIARRSLSATAHAHDADAII